MVIVTHTIEEAAILGAKILVLSDPPNRKTQILKNPGSGKKDYRHSKDFHQVCQVLRSMLQQ
jgi:NitT/TauT family transport system ATP-binding protein